MNARNDNKDREEKVITRDIALSVLVGPLKFLIPVIGYLILYPVILHKSGIEIIGLWSLLTTIVSYISLTDIGFSQLLTREAGTDRSKNDLVALYKDYISSQRAYWLICLLLLMVVILFSGSISRLINTVYSERAFLISLILLVLGSTVSLIAKLDAAILSARNDNYYIQVVGAISPVFTYALAVYGAWAGRPIEGYSLGMLLTSVTQIFCFRWRMASRHKSWKASKVTVSIRSSGFQILSLARRGWYLYSISIGFVLREPLFRWIISISLGLETVGVYSIAQRITMTARNLVTSGFYALYPSLAYLNRREKTEEWNALIRISLLILIALGAGAIGSLLLTADLILPLWLGQIPDYLIISIQILGIWNVLTVANVPFWYLLQASGHENKAAFSIWLHTVFMFFLIPLCKIFNIDLPLVLIYWLLTGVSTQILIYYYAEKELSAFWQNVLNIRMFLLIILALFFLSLGLSTPTHTPAQDFSVFDVSLLARMIPVFMYLILIILILWYPLRGYLFKKQEVIANS